MQQNGKFLRRHGDPGEAIVSVAEKEKATFIVTGCRGMGLLRRTFMGSVSDYVMHHAHCPVLVCRKWRDSICIRCPQRMFTCNIVSFNLTLWFRQESLRKRFIYQKRLEARTRCTKNEVLEKTNQNSMYLENKYSTWDFDKLYIFVLD